MFSAILVNTQQSKLCLPNQPLQTPSFERLEMQAAAFLIFVVLMIYAAISDLTSMRIPNVIPAGLVLAFFVYAIGTGTAWTTVVPHIATGAAVLVVSFALFALGVIGGGDAKLAAAIALWLGTGLVLDYLLLAAILGGLLTLLILCFRNIPQPAFTVRWEWANRLYQPRTGVPYGIALAAAALKVLPSSTLWALG